MSDASRKAVIGLLGAPGSGKSFVARELEKLGCAVIDADTLAHQVLSEPEVQAELVHWLGPQVLDGSGAVDRRAVGRLVFDDEPARKRLESLVHPRVHARREALRRDYQTCPEVKAIVEDSPLLLESGIWRECDVLVFVEASRGVRLRRVGERGWDEAELARREKNQAPLDKKRQLADYVISNDEDAGLARADISRIFSQILQDASEE